MDLPKVLILNQPFNSNTGGGVTLTNLFSGWDSDKLAVVCSPYLLKDVNLKVCTKYYQIGDLERKWLFPFKIFSKSYESGSPVLADQNSKDTSNSDFSYRKKLITRFVYPLLDYVGLSNCVSKSGISRNLIKWIENFNPDIIYAQAAFREDIHFCLAVHSYFEKPLVFHQMDDWPSTIANKTVFGSYWKNKVNRELKVLIDKSSLLLSISDLMGEEYKRRYGKSFITFHNPINLPFWQKYERNNFELSEIPTLLYAGRVGLGIDKSLEAIAKAIQIINEELNLNLRFVLQTKEKPRWLENYKDVQHNEPIAYNDLPEAFASADLLILPYDFDTKSVSFIKYSMPTKASEYMACGTPIIVFAPASTALVNDAVKYEWAKVITKIDVKFLGEEICKLIMNKNERRSLSIKAKQVARLHHNDQLVSEKFKKALCNLTSHSSNSN